MTSAGDEDLKLALEALTASIPIITSSKVANAKAGEYIIAHLDCGCRFSEQRQLTKSRTTLLECVLSLGQLIEVKHAKCIADRAVSNAAAAAVAAQKESLTGTFFGTMMNASAAQATSERRAAELLAARELVKSSKQAATVAEQRAEAARRAEVEAAAAFLAPRNDAESEAASLAAAAAAARSALAELESKAKRTCGEQADAEPTEPNEDPRRWGISTYRTQEKWSATRRAVPITEDAEHVEMQRGDTKGYMHHPRRGLIGAVQDWARGSKANVVKIVVRLTSWFGVEEEVREKLGVKQSRAAKLDAEIVDRLADALDLLKPCANLEQTHIYKVPSTRPAPPPPLPLPLPPPLPLYPYPYPYSYPCS